GTVGADAPCDLLGKITFQIDTLFQDGEQFDLGGTVTLGHVDDKSVDDLLQCQDGPVDLAGAHADTTAVDGGVGASVDDRGTAVGDLDPVTVPPGVGVHGEVAVPQPLPGLVPPEEDGHGGGGFGHHQFADLTDQLPTVGVPGRHVHAECSGLEFTFVHRERGGAAHQAAAHVRAPAGVEEPQVGAEFVVDPGQGFGAEGRAGGADGAQGGKVPTLPGADAFLHAGGQVTGAGTEDRHTRVGDQVPQRAQVGGGTWLRLGGGRRVGYCGRRPTLEGGGGRRVGRASVIQDDGGSGQQDTDQEVPHHPPGGGEPEHPVPRLCVHVQVQVLE